MTEEEISMILNTYMYMDYKEAQDGMTVGEILQDMSALEDFQEGGIHNGEYTVLAEAAQNPEIAGLIIGNQSYFMGCDAGTVACTFQAEDGSTYLVYRGTADGEWPDNGMGMTKASTLQQERALAYFEKVVEQEGITGEQKLIVTGHSKGGNKAQYVTMSTKYSELIDACYNIDGQGFSQAAVSHWESTYSAEEYEARRNKITGIYGENDYVNVLGISIVAAGNVYYVKTPVKVENFAGYHDIKYMFATLEKDEETGELVNRFHGKKNDYTPNQGKLGSYAQALSGAVMVLPEDKRDGCAASLMQLMELGGKRKRGINGEKLTLADIRDFLGTGVPLILESLLLTGQGQDMLSAALYQKTFSQDMKGTISVMVDCEGLYAQIQQLKKLEGQLGDAQRKVEETGTKIPRFMKNNWLLCRKINREAEQLEAERKELLRLAGKLEKIVSLYREKDAEAAEEILLL